MEFLVEFNLHIPEGTPEAEVKRRVGAEAAATARLAREGHLARVWKPPVAPGERKAVGLYRADSEAQLGGVLDALPLRDWLQIRVTPLEPHPNDPASTRAAFFRLPDPRLTPVYRLEATLEAQLDLGDAVQGHRRIVPLAGGTFSADWQTILPDGTALGDIRYTLKTNGGDLLYVQSRGVRHGPAEVLARLGRGEDVDPSEYTFRAATQIETAAPELDWLNKGVFVSVAGRQATGVIYETYLVG
jgi:muconolactone delta-isomerase